MIVCVCNNVSEREMAGEIAAGCRSFAELQERTGVALACASCHDCARQTYDRHANPPITLNCAPRATAGARVQGFGRRLIPIPVAVIE